MDGTLPRQPIYWGEKECEHIAQFYDDDEILIDTFTEFARSGLLGNESPIVIATRRQLREIEDRLNSTGVNVTMNRLLDHYLTVDAEEALSKFMVNRWPDDQLFLEFVMELIDRVTADGRRVRVGSEMAALLWERGDTAAAVQLEYLWDNFCKVQKFSILCTYPKAGFTEETFWSMADIRVAHSRVI
jgi:MEDS: MEthanogen/methylotroph, DcmR Sensory domain